MIAPNGGPKDTNPPKPIQSFPPNYSCNFKENKIEIDFDEFLYLKEINSQLIISPPLKELPEVKTRGKKLIIDLKEKLKENTTYTLFFGDAITDLNEGNPLSSYEFVFSTGYIIDSLTITGKVIDAASQNPEKDIYIMLYDKYTDSIPYKEKPYYVSKTKEDGSFRLNNLRDMPYKIFAIKEMNNNLLFDDITEKIAYADSLVTPHIKPIIKPDTTFNDSLKLSKIPKDSLINDSLNKLKQAYKSLSIKDLRLFQEIDSTQKLLKAEFKNNNTAIIEFKYPVKSLKYNMIHPKDTNIFKIDEWNKNKDSLTFWLLKPDLDSIIVSFYEINNGNDSVYIYKRKGINPIAKNNVKSNISSTFNYFDKVHIFCSLPVLNTDSILLTLFTNTDTNNLYAYKSDSNCRRFSLKQILKSDQTYKLVLKQGVMKDISGNANDSLVLNFKTNTAEDFGNFFLKINSSDSVNSFIIQILSEKGEVKSEQIYNKNKLLIFKNLEPGSYQIKAIKDKNANVKWDTGNYLKNIQPEEVFFYSSKITIRANWDLEETWTF
jgi:hypothetical protein